MELRRLRYFLAVVEEGGFTRAAARLQVSQPTLSQQIQVLERTVGGALFDRQPGGARLTPAGEALLDPARRALEAVAEGLRAARDIAGSTSGPLRVGMIYGAAGSVTQPILSAFARAFPDVRLHFRGELPVGQAYTALLDGEVDVAFTRLPLHPLRHAWITLYEERRVVVVHTQHPLADAATATLDQVLPLPILAANPARTAPEVNDHWLLNDFRNGEPPPLYLSEAWTVVEIAQTLVHTPTVVAMCSEIARQLSPLPNAPLRFLDLPEAGTSQAVIARRQNDHRPIVEAFCHLAATVAHR
ncbi:LysR family transcriptional regulator [Actinocrispum wychmicini]|uniref:LysR family cyn operon transcriptional activator n=1 Tax=Actinocrispum wychmicini TaxID=1213861 RepID=A0A4R2J5D0_9PSEU|nr:LysR family transcriptional regulator [Actinocrispum wychmicini]TCO54033.1 LysR family cyn operon transcriptional activator [Actinocrispum wychmicini]